MREEERRTFQSIVECGQFFVAVIDELQIVFEILGETRVLLIQFADLLILVLHGRLQGGEPEMTDERRSLRQGHTSQPTVPASRPAIPSPSAEPTVSTLDHPYRSLIGANRLAYLS